MNERIKELADEAGMTKILNEHASEYGSGVFENTPYPELEKFAKLIVRECVGICLERHDSWKFDDESNSNSGPRDCAQMIEEHFGVE